MMLHDDLKDSREFSLFWCLIGGGIGALIMGITCYLIGRKHSDSEKSVSKVSISGLKQAEGTQRKPSVEAAESGEISGGTLAEMARVCTNWSYPSSDQ